MLLISSLRRRLDSDSGFTLVELLVTMFVISSVLLGLIGVQVKALQGVGLAKQRQQATALANRTMEQMRALPYDTVSAGLLSTDLAGDSNISVVSGVTSFTPKYNSSISEMLVSSSTQAAAPLTPHTQSVTVGNVAYKIQTYVSRVDPTQNLGYWLTVLASWSSSSTGGQVKFEAVRSRLFSPTGCNATSTATRPFAGPCQAFFYTDAGAPSAGITVAPTAAGAQLVSGIDATGIDVSTPSISVRTQNEQIVSTQSTATTSMGSITGSFGTSTTGGQNATSAADTDPATGIAAAPASASALAFSGSSLTQNGSNGSFTVSLPTSADGSVYSTTAAASSPPCQDTSGTALTTGLACSAGNLTPNGAYSTALTLNVPGRNLGSFTLASIASPATPSTWRAYGARATSAAAGHCTSTSGVGCVASGVQRGWGQVTAGQLPSAGNGDTVPAGFTAMASLTGYTAAASAEAGIGVAAPTATRSGATLSYWNGTSMQSVTLGAGAASYTLGQAVGTYKISGQPNLTVTMNGTVTVDPAATTGSVPCASTGCQIVSTVGGVRLSVIYSIMNGATSLGSFVVTTDLGATMAQSTYKAAPSA